MNKRGTYTTLDEYVYVKTGKHISELNNYKPSYHIENLDRARELLLRYATAKLPIVLFGDYDVDGMGATSIGYLLLSYLQANFWVYAPKRSVDGYGLSTNFIKRLAGLQRGLLITVDNGIAAIDAILAAKRLGWEVLILDHHEAAINEVTGQITLPRADLIIDPEVFPRNCDFTHYCGAGLIYKLAMTIVTDQTLREQMCAIAAISTVGDVVMLTDDNRQIVQEGLKIINSGKATVGINKLIERLDKVGRVTATDIGFTISPMLNAASRLETEYGPNFSGSDYSISMLLETNEVIAAERAAALYEINETRKKLTKDVLESISTGSLDPVIFLKTSAPNGIVGIIASKITEATGKPAFVYSERNGICSGSSRAGDSDNNVRTLLDTVAPLMISYGGHAGAAGFKFSVNNEAKIKEILNQQKVLPAHPKGYDLEISANEIASTLLTLDQIEPFGKGMEKPIFKIRCNFTNQLEFWHGMGTDSISFDFISNNADMENSKIRAVAFHAKEEFMKHKTPTVFTIYGCPEWNYYRDKNNIQFKIDNIEYK